VRVILDTNILLSVIIKDSSTPSKVLRLVDDNHTLLISAETLEEFHRALLKPYFQRISTNLIRHKIETALLTAEQINIIESITACRDPKDNKFLELAVNGKAHFIISGAKDLLSLAAFKGTRIITPAEFLNTQLHTASQTTAEH